MNQILEEAMKGVDLPAPVRKSARLGIRLSPEEKRTIDHAAEALGMSPGEYLLELHNLAYRRIVAQIDKPETAKQTKKPSAKQTKPKSAPPSPVPEPFTPGEWEEIEPGMWSKAFEQPTPGNTGRVFIRKMGVGWQVDHLGGKDTLCAGLEQAKRIAEKTPRK